MSSVNDFDRIRAFGIWRHKVIVWYLYNVFILLNFRGIKLEIEVLRYRCGTTYFPPCFIEISILYCSSFRNPFGEWSVKNCDILDPERFQHPKSSRGRNFSNFVINNNDITFAHIDLLHLLFKLCLRGDCIREIGFLARECIKVKHDRSGYSLSDVLDSRVERGQSIRSVEYCQILILVFDQVLKLIRLNSDSIFEEICERPLTQPHQGGSITMSLTLQFRHHYYEPLILLYFVHN